MREWFSHYGEWPNEAAIYKCAFAQEQPMQSSDIGMLMLVVIAVVGSLISILDHRSQFKADKPKLPVKDKAIRISPREH